MTRYQRMILRLLVFIAYAVSKDSTELREEAKRLTEKVDTLVCNGV